MPIILEPGDLPGRHEGNVSRTILADSAVLGTNALQVERLVIGAGGSTAVVPAMNAERFVYVVRGAGQAHVGNESHGLEPESILWIEPRESYTLEAGSQELEVLVCLAPSEE